MPLHSNSELSEEDFTSLKERILLWPGQFDANDVSWTMMEEGVTNYTGDVAAALSDLERLGQVRRLEGTQPPRWVVTGKFRGSG